MSEEELAAMKAEERKEFMDKLKSAMIIAFCITVAAFVYLFLAILCFAINVLLGIGFLIFTISALMSLLFMDL